jgi:ABC-type glutathione transport system ATPase component
MRATTRPISVQKQKRLAQEGREDVSPPEDAGARAGMDRLVAQGTPGQEQGPYPAYDELVQKAATRAPTPRRSSFRSPSGSATTSSISRPVEGLGTLLIDGLSFKLPPGGIVGVIGPNGAGKTTLFKMITGQDKPDSGTITDRRERHARLCRPEPRCARRQEERLGGDLGRQRHDLLGKRESIRAPIARPSTSRAATSRRRSARSRAASATASTSPRC